MRRFYYFIGEPGVGKTTLVDALVGDRPGYVQPTPIPHVVYGDGSLAQLGVPRENFGGTDSLAMSIQPAVEDWLQQRPYSTIFAEGDRLANSKFFAAVLDAGYDLTVVLIEASMAITHERRAARAAAIGKVQNPSWVAGRQTKVMRLRRDWTDRVVRLNSNLPVHAVVDQAREAGADPFAMVAQP